VSEYGHGVRTVRVMLDVTYCETCDADPRTWDWVALADELKNERPDTALLAADARIITVDADDLLEEIEWEAADEIAGGSKDYCEGPLHDEGCPYGE